MELRDLKSYDHVLSAFKPEALAVLRAQSEELNRVQLAE